MHIPLFFRLLSWQLNTMLCLEQIHISLLAQLWCIPQCIHLCNHFYHQHPLPEERIDYSLILVSPNGAGSQAPHPRMPYFVFPFTHGWVWMDHFSHGQEYRGVYPPQPQPLSGWRDLRHMDVFLSHPNPKREPCLIPRAEIYAPCMCLGANRNGCAFPEQEHLCFRVHLLSLPKASPLHLSIHWLISLGPCTGQERCWALSTGEKTRWTLWILTSTCPSMSSYRNVMTVS